MATTERFSDATWQKIVSIAQDTFAFDQARADRLYANPTAKLIAAVPFLAGCLEPERTALAHLATFIVAGSEKGQKAFDHKPADDYDTLARLATISNFQGGDPAIISKAMKYLAMMMVEGYARDVASDKAAGIYNPLDAGVWKADEKLASLAVDTALVTDGEMEAIVSVKSPWWIPG